MLSGVTRQKNSLGELVFVLCIFIFWDFVELRKSRGRFRIRDRWDHILLFGMGLLLLHQSQSKTSLLCLGIGCALSLRGAKPASPIVSRIAFWGALSTPFLLFFTQEFGDVIAPLVKAMGRDMTFTGRANIWHQVTAQTRKSDHRVRILGFLGRSGRSGNRLSRCKPRFQTHTAATSIYISMAESSG